MRPKILQVSILLLIVCGLVSGQEFRDDFDVPTDFLLEGVEGTGWDGLIGLEEGQTAAALNASMSRPGQLYLASAGGVWAEPWNPLGPFLYKIVTGNFVATTKVSAYAGTADAWVYHNNCGLMARNVATSDGGPGEDWVSIDYFPIWNCGYFVLVADDGARSERCHNGKAFDLDPYLQLERTGDTFYFRTSQDGINWTEMPCSPIVRKDLAGIPLQVGLFQCTFSADMGYAAFDWISIIESPQLKAILLEPDNGAVVSGKPTLEWIPGDTAVEHIVYLGTDPNALEQVAKQSGTTYTLAQDVQPDVIYYWRVDEVEADGTIHTGDTWSFVGAKAKPKGLVTFVDRFDTPHDFLSEGVEGTGWDGLVGLGPGQTANAINASITSQGQLYLESSNSFWSEPWNPLGPFLYKIVYGDFIASVKVVGYAGDPNNPVYHNNCGLMARNVIDSDAGVGEDWVSIDYFPIWNCGNFVRTANNGARRERCNNGLAWNLYPYLQLERKGNTFYFRVSADGINWIDMPCSPRTHDDFDGLPVAVGVFQCTYSNQTGYAIFDDFKIQTSFEDQFEKPRDFLSEGVEGTGWDGLVGLGPGQTANAINASITSQGQLYLESSNSFWSEPWNPLGPFLYKIVYGDFIASVKVVGYAGDPNNPVYHNNCGLMARNVIDSDAGVGEDWVSIDYFPIWNCGNFVRTANNGARRERCNNGLAWNLYPYLQLERKGNTFYFRVSADGINWIDMPCSPRTHDDFDGLPVAVGVFQCTYSNQTGYAIFDQFRIITQ
jgi:hypothetical protein